LFGFVRLLSFLHVNATDFFIWFRAPAELSAPVRFRLGR
jgi:hypothetical protein